MIVNAPEIEYCDDQVRIASEIEWDRRPRSGFPQKLWFAFPRSCERYLTARTDPFVAALLQLAMVLGEDIEVRGQVSSKLAYGIREYEEAYTCYRPDLYRVVEVRIEKTFAEPENTTSRAVGCAFSGGVDSWYSLWSHLGDNEPQPQYRVTHAVFMHGFDLRPEARESYRTALQGYKGIIADIGIDLIHGETNVRHFSDDYIQWTVAFDGPLLGAGLCLQRLFARYYVSSSMTYGQLRQEGSTPLFLDYLLGSDGLEVLHYGATVSRMKKIEAISKWPVTYPGLRVCWAGASGLQNCCECTKCQRTMIELEAYGALSRYSTFSAALSQRTIRNWRLSHVPERIYAHEIVKEAMKLGRKDLAFDIRCALWRGKMREIRMRAWKRCKSAFKRTAKGLLRLIGLG